MKKHPAKTIQNLENIPLKELLESQAEQLKGGQSRSDDDHDVLFDPSGDLKPRPKPVN
ncbi:MAG: hypothetical protein F6K42_11165 [Leptolyngbya sp. SIO1D8]|nr:hypothetical protein [Leptolyngbya sp. SIO1D8]